MRSARFNMTKNPRTWLQIGVIVSPLLPTFLLLLVGILVSQQLTGIMAMFLLLIVSVALIVVFLSSTLLFFLVQRKVDKSFHDLAASCDAYREGDSSIRLHVTGEDPFSQVQLALNALFEQFSQLKNPTENNGQLSPLDHFVEKRREKASTGLYVVERAAEERETQHGAILLSRAARNLVDRSAFQEQALRAQTIQIFQTTEKVESLAVFIHQLSRNAQGAGSLAQTGLKRLRKSQDSLQNTAQEMGALKQQTQRATQKMYRVGEHSHVLIQVVQIIEELSQQLTFLSQHSALAFSATEEQETALAQLARQIQHMAKRASDATNQIMDLNTTIEADMREAVSSLQVSSKNIVERIKDVEDAGQSLQDLYNSMEFQSGMIDDMVQSTSEQSMIVDATTTAMSQIAKVAYQSGKEMQQQVQGLKKLVQASEQLQIAASQAREAELTTPPALPTQNLEPQPWDETTSPKQSKA